MLVNNAHSRKSPLQAQIVLGSLCPHKVFLQRMCNQYPALKRTDFVFLPVHMIAQLWPWVSSERSIVDDHIIQEITLLKPFDNLPILRTESILRRNFGLCNPSHQIHAEDISRTPHLAQFFRRVVCRTPVQMTLTTLLANHLHES